MSRDNSEGELKNASYNAVVALNGNDGRIEKEGIKIMNSTSSESFDERASWIAFWFSAVICAITAVVSIFGNGMVIYVASSKDDLSRFKYMNWAVKNLAISDLMYGIIAVPLTIVHMWWGKQVL